MKSPNLGVGEPRTEVEHERIQRPFPVLNRIFGRLVAWTGLRHLTGSFLTDENDGRGLSRGDWWRPTAEAPVVTGPVSESSRGELSKVSVSVPVDQEGVQPEDGPVSALAEKKTGVGRQTFGVTPYPYQLTRQNVLRRS